MKYDNEFEATDNREDFIKLAIRNYGTTYENARKRYYEARMRARGTSNTPIKQKYNPAIIKEKTYTNEEKSKPNPIKMFDYEDLKRFGGKLSRAKLSRYGFNEKEINWLVDEKGLVINE
jgi:hypothetical protein